MPLSVADREAFLAESHIASLAVETGEERAPLNVPVWYDYSPGGEVRFLTDGDSRKARLIAKAGRFSLLVQRASPTYRYVSVEGPVVRSAPTTWEELTRISARYLLPDAAEGYVQGSDLDVLVTFRMRPEHWLSADLGALG
ncbi:pyridoxamine 5'-phosphate oxidase family protein [Nonomuraea sp. K274]|uniref:Pyridoxamine 5'-phosphate oxidase family protein n=1 Tax=Nonomuraea cypriaca TaxID=1187855 RepID=A0A931ACW8_9ACTN|nr:pyridoxamine 5'-phosphate oxidase family protein [Nonomuraea cypriaca]MBF8190531.1 pyridoxamine 5'-phosphate oxidase family protein [Nonomuraea cypriaca]